LAFRTASPSSFLRIKLRDRADGFGFPNAASGFSLIKWMIARQLREEEMFLETATGNLDSCGFVGLPAGRWAGVSTQRHGCGEAMGIRAH
jgi:hypothetical protein